MERTRLVKLYNLLGQYFTKGIYPKVETKEENSCKELIEELEKVNKEVEKEKK